MNQNTDALQVHRQSGPRLVYLDFARGLAILFMMLVHVLETYASLTVYNGLFGRIIDFLGGPPAAPVFMFIMGIFLVYPRDRGFLKSVRRGITIMLLGYLLSFLRYNLPELLGITSYPYEFDPFSFVWEVDILPFAGLALIVLASIRKVLPWPAAWALIAAAFAAVSPLLWGIGSDLPIVGWLFGLLWGDGSDVFFPLFPWLAFPLLGMVYGVVLKTGSRDSRFHSRFALLGLVLLVVGTIITAADMVFHLGDYYRSGPGGMVWMIGFVLVWLYVCEQITRKFADSRLSALFSFWSRHITRLYFLHWILLGWGVALFPYRQQSLLTTILLMIVLVPTTHWCTQAWAVFVTKLRERLMRPSRDGA